jgi:hypothetical protein
MLRFSTTACVIAIDQGHSEVVPSFLLGKLGRVVRFDGLSIASDGRGPITACPDSVLGTVANFEPGATVVWTCRSSPPMKSAAAVADFSVGGGDVI